MLLGSADILLTELLTLLTPRQAADPAPGRGLPRPDDPRRPRLRPHRRPRPDGISRQRSRPGSAARRRGPADRPHPAHARPGHRHAPMDRRPGHPQHRDDLDRPARAGAGDAAAPVRAEPRQLRRPARHPPPPGRPAPLRRHRRRRRAGRSDPARHPGHRRLPRRDPPPDPATERAWILVADLEVQALLSAGDLPAATRQLHAIHQQVQARAAADPANTEWQRDLSVSHNRLGDVAVAAGDLAAARDRLPGRPRHPRAAGRRRPRQHRMAARPVDQPQQARGRGGGGRGPGRRPRPLPGRPRHPRAAGRRRPRQHRVAARPVGQPQQARGYGGGGRGPGRRPRPPTRPAWTSAERLAAADPANTEWQRDLSVSHNKLGDVAVAAGDLAAARDRYQAASTSPSGWPPPTPPTPGGSATCRSATTCSGMWPWRPGTWPPPAPPTRPASTSPSGWPPPTPPTPSGSATCRSATTSSGMWRWRPGTWPPPATATRPPRHRRAAGRRRPRQHRVAARPVGQPQQARGRGGGGRGPGRRPRPLPGQPRHRRAAGRRRPRQHRVAARPVGQPQQAGDVAVAAGDLAAARDRLPGQPRHRRAAGRRRPRQHRVAARPVGQPRPARGCGAWRPGTWPPPATATRPASTSPSGWPPPTPPTPSGSATCQLHAKSSSTLRAAPQRPSDSSDQPAPEHGGSKTKARSNVNWWAFNETA